MSEQAQENNGAGSAENGMKSLVALVGEPINARMKEGSTKVIDPKLFEGWNKALELRLRGFNYNQIAKAMGISHTLARKYCRKAMEHHGEPTREKTVRLRNVESLRYDKILQKLMVKAFPDPIPEKEIPSDWTEEQRRKNKNPDLDYQAVNLILRTMQQHATLMGLNEAKKFQVDVHEMKSQVAVIVQKIVRVLPEEYAPKVLSVLNEAQQEATGENSSESDTDEDGE